MVYIARPCQYDAHSINDKCKDSAYWTNKRFSEEVVASINEAIDSYTKRSEAKEINLIGYSGGGAIAVLVAARRDDVASIRTVAGNLDHVASSKHHKASSLEGSLNAKDVAKKTAYIPQRHFAGSKDEVIPTFIAEEFREEAGNSNCVFVAEIKGFSHADGWEESWRELLKKPVTCEV